MALCVSLLTKPLRRMNSRARPDSTKDGSRCSASARIAAPKCAALKRRTIGGGISGTTDRQAGCELIDDPTSASNAGVPYKPITTGTATPEPTVWYDTPQSAVMPAPASKVIVVKQKVV